MFQIYVLENIPLILAFVLFMLINFFWKDTVAKYIFLKEPN